MAACKLADVYRDRMRYVVDLCGRVGVLPHTRAGQACEGRAGTATTSTTARWRGSSSTAR